MFRGQGEWGMLYKQFGPVSIRIYNNDLIKSQDFLINLFITYLKHINFF